MERIVIRRAAEEDLAEIVALSREHAQYEAAAYVYDNQEEGLREALFGPTPSLHAWVVAAGGEPVGYMSATRDFATWTAKPFLHMDCLYLRRQFRRMGIGARLIACLADFAREQGIGLIQWQTPRDNEQGIAFYERIGASAKDKKRYFLPVPRA